MLSLVLIRINSVHNILYIMLVSSLSMFDVGGQRDERRKWIQCFNGKRVARSSVLASLMSTARCYHTPPPSFVCF